MHLWDNKINSALEFSPTDNKIHWCLPDDWPIAERIHTAESTNQEENAE